MSAMNWERHRQRQRARMNTESILGHGVELNNREVTLTPAKDRLAWRAEVAMVAWRKTLSRAKRESIPTEHKVPVRRRQPRRQLGVKPSGSKSDHGAVRLHRDRPRPPNLSRTRSNNVKIEENAQDSWDAWLNEKQWPG